MKYLGFIWLVMSGYVMAEDVYYCSDNNSAGSLKNEEGQYKQANFHAKKFKMKLQGNGNIVIADPGIGRDALFICSAVSPDLQDESPEYKHHKSCVKEHYTGHHFNFNVDNGRYVWLKGSGYVFNTNAVVLSIGTCTKF